jgi:radical SAM protein with 4Fe4S-binding SPASM domain
MTKTIKTRRRYRPFYAALEVTRRCNMSCVHCGSDATRRERPGALTHAQWLGLIDGLARSGTRRVTLSGGEPFLYPRWRELVRRVRERKMGADFISNGSCIKEDDVLFMKAQGVRHVAVSLDGDEAVHDAIRRTPGSFGKIMRLLDLGRKHDFAVNIVTSINRLNFPVRDGIRRIVLANGVRIWQVQIVNSFGRAGMQREKLLIGPEQYVRLCDDVLRWRKAHAGAMRVEPADSLGYCHPVTDALFGDCEWRGCNAGVCVVGIQADGAVVGCLSLQDKGFVAGNVKERPFSDIWDDPASFPYTRRYPVPEMEGACGACPSRRRCKAGCLGMAYSVTGTLTRNPYCYKTITG